MQWGQTSCRLKWIPSGVQGRKRSSAIADWQIRDSQHSFLSAYLTANYVLKATRADSNFE